MNTIDSDWMLDTNTILYDGIGDDGDGYEDCMVVVHI